MLTACTVVEAVFNILLNFSVCVVAFVLDKIMHKVNSSD